jgi:predicted N-acetyltransferase YhbS
MLVELAPDHPLHDRVLDQTYPLWHDQLTPVRYAQYNRAQLRTRWGAAHLRRVALVDGDRVLASAKRYALTVRLDGRHVPTLGIGAVFTPPDLRRRGFARRLLQEMLAAARDAGAELAMLFSEIDPAFYEAVGFRLVPVPEASLTVRRARGAPAVLARSVEERDFPFIADMHEQRAAAYRFSLHVDADWIQYSVAKKRMLSGLGPPGTRDVEGVIAEEGGRAAAWLLLQVSRPARASSESWSVAACGDRDPDGARVGALLQTLIARTPAARPPAIRAWWPQALQPPQVTFRVREAAGTRLMLCPLAGHLRIVPPLRMEDVLYWHGDAF